MSATSVDVLAIVFLAFEILLVASITLALFTARKRIGLAPLYIFIGSNQYLSVVLASTIFVSISPGLAVSPGSVVLFGDSLFAILLVYLRTDIPHTRGLVYGVVIANATLVGLLWLTSQQISYFDTSNILNVPLQLFSVQPRIFLSGTIVLLLDFFLVVMLYEYLVLKAKYTPRLLRILITMMAVLMFDGLVFSTVAFYGQPGYLDVLRGQILGKAFSGVIYGGILYLYLRVIDPMEDDKHPGYTEHLRDVFSLLTHRDRYRQIKDQLEEAEAVSLAKSRFLANMSHELRTPLNAIIGFTSVLIRRDDTVEDSRHLLGRVLVKGKHLLELINGLLDLSKIESGKNVLNFSKVKMPELVTETVEQLMSQATEKNIELTVELPPRATALDTDRMRMKQILINLLGSSLKFTDTGGVIARLEANPDSGEVTHLHILDSGVGIPADKINEIFLPFYQNVGHDRSRQGTGLGLSIANALCVQMGHRLKVISREGHGSQFSIVFNDEHHEDSSEAA